MPMKKPKFEVRNQGTVFFVFFCFAISYFLWGVPVHSALANTATIRIFKNTTVETEQILLGKIAEITGEDRNLVRKIHAIVIGKAPLPGKSRRIDEDYIKLRLKQNDINLSQIKLHIPGKIEVFRASIEITKEEIEKIASDFIIQRIPFKKNRVKIKKIQVSHGLILPKGNITYRVVPPKSIESFCTIPLSIFFD